jgi:hypothetical protein
MAAKTALQPEGAYRALGRMPSISAEAQALYDGWNPAVTSIGRLRQNLMKVALLTASAKGEKEVTADCMSKAIRFMEWQLKIREIFKPSKAEAGNKEAVFTNLLLPALEQKGALTEFVSWRRVSLDRKINPQFRIRYEKKEVVPPTKQQVKEILEAATGQIKLLCELMRWTAMEGEP